MTPFAENPKFRSCAELEVLTAVAMKSYILGR
jgi:hypothetical protein